MARARAFAVLVNLADQVRGYAHVEAAAIAVRHDVDPAALSRAEVIDGCGEEEKRGPVSSTGRRLGFSGGMSAPVVRVLDPFSYTREICLNLRDEEPPPSQAYQRSFAHANEAKQKAVPAENVSPVALSAQPIQNKA